MAKLLKVLLYTFLLAYAGALILWLVGTLGLFGQPKDPLSGVFLILLGLPWTRLVDHLPEALWPAAAAATPLLNAGVLFLLRRWAAHRQPS